MMKLATASILCLTTSMPLFAQRNDRCPCADPSDVSEKHFATETTPEAVLSPSRQTGPFKSKASFLIWQSKEWGLEFASKSRIPSDPSSSTQTFSEHLYISDFAWCPGLKVDLGYSLPFDGWDFGGRWTYYSGNCTNLKKHFDSQIAPTGMGIVPLWHYPFIDISSSSAPLRFGNAAANWKLFFNTFDLELGRQFLPTQSIPVRLHLGIKSSLIRQYYHALYQNGTTVEGIGEAPTPQNFRYITSRTACASDSWGIGPRGGFGTLWNLGAGFHIIGEGSLAVLTSFFHLSTDCNDLLFNVSQEQGTTNFLRMKEKMRELIPVFEGKIGIDWGMNFGRGRTVASVGLTIGYELQYWWAQNHMRRSIAFLAPGNLWDMSGDLQMHGLTASLRGDY